MSGHSKWSNIKNRKGAQDKKRSEAFTRLAKDILTAIRTGVGLKVAIDKAREANMPKENIERLLSRFEERKANLVEAIMEGYGPFGVPIIISIETDNRNRILAEIKLILKNFNGSLGENGSVMFQFERVGEIELENIDEEKQLELIDMGVVDIEGNIVWVESEKYNEFLDQIKGGDKFRVIRSELVYKSINPINLKNETELNTILDLIEELEENDDVVGVYAGFDYN
ncbi:MAG: YebC/PmpR family DNA-binding transcriptional regulator [Candidatus Shapirobacteria bacterium]|nr:YebC/PmpR family DNA-binding transcriptional regulator [Candidatus Shapirobacteria bacterium]